MTGNEKRERNDNRENTLSFVVCRTKGNKEIGFTGLVVQWIV